ncbi:caspase family protein [Methylovulum psychrotolerans]|uniref:Peptidase C14 caspase domain-containing protein n=1 Tax=Methylovulum psychrotolerans TaxID=1704499 RepID=A0A1Z4BUX2_9GAMM|nr:caspase family protein [Methylovulum psychrotolerans]ASF44999.1 hypothetical protein CEK71_02355 [Methylovulum psychrotolerans]
MSQTVKFRFCIRTGRLVAVASLLLLSGCATVGSKMLYNITAEEEAQGCQASHIANSNIKIGDCERASKLIKQAGMAGGYVGYDSTGRLQLRGDYQDETEVDRAFLVVQTLVGASSLAVSPITPRNVGEITLEKIYTPPADQASLSQSGHKYALLVGVSTFRNFPDKGIETADDDVLALDKLLRNKGFETEQLIDSAATKQNIIAAMNKIKAVASAQDTVLFYISTHGLPPDKLGQLEIVPYDMAKPLATTNPQPSDQEIIDEANSRYHVMQTAISQEELQSFLKENHAGKFIAIVDTCYSGAAMGTFMKPLGGDQYVQLESQYAYSLPIQQIGNLMGAGSKDLFTEQQSVTQTSSASAYNSEQESSVEVFDYPKLPVPPVEPQNIAAQHLGRVFLTATSGNETSKFQKQSRMKNSIFTYYLVDGLKREDGQVAKAFDYAKARTSYHVLTHPSYFGTPKDKTPSQTPQMESLPHRYENLGLFY